MALHRNRRSGPEVIVGPGSQTRVLCRIDRAQRILFGCNESCDNIGPEVSSPTQYAAGRDSSSDATTTDTTDGPIVRGGNSSQTRLRFARRRRRSLMSWTTSCARSSGETPRQAALRIAVTSASTAEASASAPSAVVCTAVHPSAAWVAELAMAFVEDDEAGTMSTRMSTGCQAAGSAPQPRPSSAGFGPMWRTAAPTPLRSCAAWGVARSSTTKMRRAFDTRLNAHVDSNTGRKVRIPKPVRSTARERRGRRAEPM